MHAPLLPRLFLDAWIVALIVWLVAALFTKKSERTEPPATRVIQWVCAIVSIFLLSFRRLPWGPLGIRVIPRSLFLGYAGLVLTIGGIAFAIWARVYIGRNWSARVTVKKDHELIRTGPYAIVRHPIYSGFIIALIGTTIGIGQIRAILAVAIVIWGLSCKIKTEEKFMSDQFGEEYENYKRKVKSLIPFIW